MPPTPTMSAGSMSRKQIAQQVRALGMQIAVCLQSK
jgi:hypothetical protein